VKRLAIAFLLCAMLVAALAATASGFAVTYANGPDPAVSSWPEWPYPVGCLGVTFDPVAVFGGPTEAEKGNGAPELALRRYLDEGLYPQLPTKFWRQVAASPGRVSFSSGRLEQGLFWLTAAETSPGQWSIVGNVDECGARSIRDGEAAIDWALAKGQKLDRETRRIEVELHPSGACDGGRSHNDAAQPRFRRTGRKLVLTIWLKPLPPGNYTCKRRREGPLSLRLPGPLGDRRLWDGGSFPPRRES
jgi:hypothetical protein